MSVSSGTRLGPYEILELVGAGGMGEVYRATDSRLGRTVAVKVLSNRFSNRFEGEARAIAALNHPYICTLYDVGPDYLVMEYVEGKPLGGRYQEEEALRLAGQMAEALEEAHRRGIIHRDLKPANIMVTAGGSVKLLDFGLAKFTPNDQAATTQTMEGAVAGTVAYMSPEQGEGKPVDERTDIFSFGVVLYEMLAGRRAFGGDSMAAVLSAVLRDDPAPLETWPALQRIVIRCLKKQPAQRFQSMTEVRAALEQASAKRVEKQPSIAVLPFADMSAGQENEYFGDGLAEEIINALAHIAGLKVIARTSAFAFKGKNEDVRRIADALGVGHVLEGSVRKAGHRIRITAQLIDASDGGHLWSERYDREMVDVFAIQDDIAAAISGALRLKLTPAAVRAAHTPNLPAYEAYMMGLYHSFKTTPDAMARGAQYYQEAIALDPAYAAPHVAQAITHFTMAAWGLRPAHESMPLARSSAEKALDLDPTLADAHAMVGAVAAMYDYDWAEAERRFRLAMAAVPAPAFARLFYANYYLLPLGRGREASEEMERVIEADPLNVLYRSLLGLCLHAGGMGERASAELRRGLQIEGNHWTIHLVACWNYVSRGILAEALDAAEHAYRLAPWQSQTIGMLAGTVSLTGDRERAEGLVQKLKELPSHRIPVGMVTYHLICAEAEAALDWLEKAIEQRDVWAARYPRLALTKILRPSPRWPPLMRMMHLKDAI
jgi:serine/threonine-protein kinase